MNPFFLLAPVLFFTVSLKIIPSVREHKPDLVVNVSQFRIDNDAKKIFFKVQLINIGDTTCNINQIYSIQTYLSTDQNIGNDTPSGGRAISVSFKIEPGKSRLLSEEYFFSYQSLQQLEKGFFFAPVME